MTGSSDVLVIGAGAIGASTAYHLADKGIAVTVVDQFAAASQTSPRAAGLSTTITRDRDYAPLAQRSARKLAELGQESEHGIRIERTGVVRLTRRETLIENVRNEVRRGKVQGIEVEAIDGEEAARLTGGLIDPGPIKAVTFASDELYLPDPGEIARAYLQAARDRGADVVTDTKVDRFDLNGGRISGVRSAHRTLGADVIVLCANAGNGRLAGLLGIALPTIPMRHQLCITAPVRDMAPGRPQVKIVDGNVYVRPHGTSVLVGGFEPDPVVFSHEQAAGIDMRSLTLDPAPLRRLMAGIADVLPGVARAPISELRGGIVSMTADGRYILDRVPGIDNAWIAAGDSAGGNTTSPMIGQVIAEWIVDGSPSISLDSFSLSRLQRIDEGEAMSQAIRQYVDMIALD